MNAQKNAAPARMPKGQKEWSAFQVRWVEVLFHSGRQVSCSRYYASLEEAQAAAEVARSHKSKRGVRALEVAQHACPDSAEVQCELARNSGAEWNSELGTYLYSARY